MKFPLLHLLAPVCLFVTTSIQAQVPNLRTAAPFTLFTAAGAFTNVGNSIVRGDIGTFVGAYTGFPPGTLIGIAHIANAVAQQAALDVQSAYDQLTLVPCTIPMNVNIGNNEVFTPGTYCAGALTTLNGQLTFDGEGNPNAIFIIKIGAAFTAAASSNIVLTNGAALKNIYWQVGGEVNINDNAHFTGNIIADGAIHFLEAATLTGRALSVSGAITLQNNNIQLPATILSASLLNIGLQVQGRQVIVSWSTASEQNNSHFLIERSSNGSTQWVTAGQVAGAGNSSSVTRYAFTDVAPFEGNNYYRISSVQQNGGLTQSSVAYIKLSAQGGKISVYPNPVGSNITVSGAPAGSIIVINGTDGKQVLQQTIGSNGKVATGGLRSGTYLLTVIDKDKRTTTQILKP